jgi:hypothetical protein
MSYRNGWYIIHDLLRPAGQVLSLLPSKTDIPFSRAILISFGKWREISFLLIYVKAIAWVRI